MIVWKFVMLQTIVTVVLSEEYRTGDSTTLTCGVDVTEVTNGRITPNLCWRKLSQEIWSDIANVTTEFLPVHEGPLSGRDYAFYNYIFLSDLSVSDAGSYYCEKFYASHYEGGFVCTLTVTDGFWWSLGDSWFLFSLYLAPVVALSMMFGINEALVCILKKKQKRCTASNPLENVEELQEYAVETSRQASTKTVQTVVTEASSTSSSSDGEAPQLPTASVACSTASTEFLTSRDSTRSDVRELPLPGAIGEKFEAIVDVHTSDGDAESTYIPMRGTTLITQSDTSLHPPPMQKRDRGPGQNILSQAKRKNLQTISEKREIAADHTREVPSSSRKVYWRRFEEPLPPPPLAFSSFRDRSSSTEGLLRNSPTLRRSRNVPRKQESSF